MRKRTGPRPAKRTWGRGENGYPGRPPRALAPRALAAHVLLDLLDFRRVGVRQLELLAVLLGALEHDLGELIVLRS